MEVVLEAMADGGVMTGIPHSLSLRMSAHTMIVRWYDGWVEGRAWPCMGIRGLIILRFL